MTSLTKIVASLKESKSYEKSKVDRYSFRGLSILSTVVADNFLNIEQLPHDRFSKTGVFYEIPVVSDSADIFSSNQVFLIVLYKVEANKSSFCPLRIDYEQQNDDTCKIWVYDQSGERSTKYCLLDYDTRRDTKIFSNFRDLSSLTLRGLLDIFGISDRELN